VLAQPAGVLDRVATEVRADGVEGSRHAAGR
jgi:hypothetical protein